MNKAKFVAVSGVSAAIAVVCLLLTSVFPYAVLIFAVIASIAVVTPLLVGGGLTYSLLVYGASLVVGTLSGVLIDNVLYVAPVVMFCLPFAVVKVYGDSIKVTAKVEHTETLQDPFDMGEDTKVMQVQFKGTRRLNRVLKWVIYYILLEVAIVVTLFATKYLMQPIFDRLYSSQLVFWLCIGLAQLIVPAYDLLLRGCLIGAVKILKNVIK